MEEEDEDWITFEDLMEEEDRWSLENFIDRITTELESRCRIELCLDEYWGAGNE